VNYEVNFSANFAMKFKVYITDLNDEQVYKNMFLVKKIGDRYTISIRFPPYEPSGHRKYEYRVEIFCTENLHERCTSRFIKFQAEVIHMSRGQTKPSPNSVLPLTKAFPFMCMSRYPKLYNHYYIYTCQILQPLDYFLMPGQEYHFSLRVGNLALFQDYTGLVS